MTQETVIRCDRCGRKEKPKNKKSIKLWPHSYRETQMDLCEACCEALDKWLVKDNATMPGGKGPGWEEVCHHHVPCAGPCSDPSWKRVRT